MKDAYYFPHFSNARHDRKIKRIRLDWGNQGYALYFMTLEVLRDQSDFSYPTSDIDLLADEFNVTEAELKAIIFDYKLFEIKKVDKEEVFTSPKLLDYMQPYLERSAKARKAAKKRWNANGMQEHSPSIASKVNEVKEKKEKKVNVNIYE